MKEGSLEGYAEEDERKGERGKERERFHSGDFIGKRSVRSTPSHVAVNDHSVSRSCHVSCTVNRTCPLGKCSPEGPGLDSPHIKTCL